MKVKFHSLKIQNLLSYGNNETVINFDNNGLNLITGENGTGKSSAMLDAISFALYDKPYRKIKKGELINRKNKKNLKVDFSFTINDIEYRLVRGLKNREVDLEFWIDGVQQDLLSSKGLTQLEIESKIGIDYKLFKQIISLSINYNKPFLTLSAAEKRELLEKFFNIDVLAAMLKEAKSVLKELKIKKNMEIQAIDILTSSLKTDKARILQLVESKKTFDADMKKEVDKLTDTILVSKKELKTVKAEGKAKNAELEKV